MKIVSIFAEKLFAFHYKGEDENELHRLLDLWYDVSYLHQFVKEHKTDTNYKSVSELVRQLIEDANYIDDTLTEICESKNIKLDTFFKQLHNSEFQASDLSLRKGRKNYLRLYAIRIDIDCFVITGGAIKFTHLMEDREHTKQELLKLEKAKNFLQENGVFDNDSFYEFLIELS